MPKSTFSYKEAGESPGFLLWKTTTVWQRKIKKALESYQISHSQFVIMAILLWFEEHKQEATQILLINWSKLDKMTVSNALKCLANLAYVERRENLKDTRVKTVSLTPNGKTLAQQLVPIVEKIDEDFFGSLTPEKRKSLLEILNHLTQL